MADDIVQNSSLDQDVTAADSKVTRSKLSKRMEQIRTWIEVEATLILAIATLITAWNGYQSFRWSGAQSDHYTKASALRTESIRAASQADQLMQIDVGLFTNWVNAYAKNDQTLMDFYRARFRDEFKPAFAAWLLTDPKNNISAPSSPFSMPEYSLAKSQDAALLLQKAEQEFEAGQEANGIADGYILNTVILASVLFLAGMASQVKGIRLRILVVTIALLILFWAVYSFIVLPIH